MPIDLFQSRANYNEKCRWWSRKENETTADELIMKRIPSGTFCAKEVNAEQSQDNVIAGSFMFEKTTVTIKSPDVLNGIKAKDLVEFRGERWIVVNSQRTKARIQNTFFAESDNCSHFWYLELRK